MINWKALDNVPLLFYILALKTLILCLGFAAVKIYQSKKIEAAMKKQREEERKAQALLALKAQAVLDNLATKETLDTLDAREALDTLANKKND